MPQGEEEERKPKAKDIKDDQSPKKKPKKKSSSNSPKGSGKSPPPKDIPTVENDEGVVDLKQRSVALNVAGDTQGAKELLEKARELEFQHTRPEDLDDPLRLKQYTISKKKQGELELSRQALKKSSRNREEIWPGYLGY